LASSKAGIAGWPALVNGYVAMQVLAGGARQAKSLDAAAVADALRGNAIDTLLGELSFEKDGDLVDPQIWIYQVGWMGSFRVELFAYGLRTWNNCAMVSVKNRWALGRYMQAQRAVN